MSKVSYIVIALICASPAVLLYDRLLTQGLLAAVVAVALAMTALSLRPGETEFLVSVTRPPLVVAAVPVFWIAIQALPFPPLAHPIWASAEAALGHRLMDTISIDPGASIISLALYLALAGAALVAAAVAVDRGRAEGILLALTTATVVVALVVLVHNVNVHALELSPFTYQQAITCVAMGVIFAAASCIRVVERYETRHAHPLRSVTGLRVTLLVSVAAFFVCMLILIWDGSGAVLLATGCGLATLASIVVIRRFGLGAWGSLAVAVPVIGIALVLVATQPIARGQSPLLAYAAPAAASPSSVSERVLEGAPAAGTGAGTFRAIAPIYRETDDPAPGSAAPTAAATLAIELGRPMCWLIAAAIAASIVLLIGASLQRGRDSFYPAMGASCLVTLLLLAFVNAGVLGMAAGLIAATMLGLALAQSRSRTARII